ncbi:MAG: hypothetical protein V1859_06075 [archaeon]
MKLLKDKKGIHISWELVIGLAIGVIVMIFAISFLLRGGGAGTTETAKVQKSTSTLVDKATDQMNDINNPDATTASHTKLPRIAKSFNFR